MRTITLLVIHCSATPGGQSLDFDACRRYHIRERGFSDIGYHFYITRDGQVHDGRPLDRVGAHCLHHNRHSVGICYEGGLLADGTPADTRTQAQRYSMLALIRRLHQRFPQALVVGHHDLNPLKPCPCFDAAGEYLHLDKRNSYGAPGGTMPGGRQGVLPSLPADRAAAVEVGAEEK